MSDPSHQPRAFPKQAALLALALFVLVGAMFFATRPHPKPPAPLPEVNRKNLELRDGIWYASGQTNRFTGVLLDTYVDGARKSRSAVSNGLLEGLSQGWWTNNVLQVTEYYTHGISNGERTKYYPDGHKESVATVIDGKLEGRFDRWHENGTLAEHLNLKHGEPDGESVAYHPDGSLKARVRLAEGKVLEQKFWAPGEATQVTAAAISESK